MDRYTSTEVLVENSITPHAINEEISLSFDIPRGTESVSVNDKLITNYDVAEARAKSIFLDSSYTTKRVVVSTYHIDNLYIGNIISIDSTLYIIDSIVEVIVGAKVEMKLTCERWE